MTPAQSTPAERPTPGPESRSSGHATRFVDTETLFRLRSLELRARHLVHGILSGLHRSPQHGFSVEFTEYRQYTAGDDLRFLDWKVLARSDRYFLKKFEDETNLRCQLLLDCSRSMDYGSTGWTKLEYAKTIVATVALFLLSQRDAIGWGLVGKRLETYVEPRFRSGHFRRLLADLSAAVVADSSPFAAALETMLERSRGRSLLVLVSDLWLDWPSLFAAMKRAVAAGHEVMVLQVLDRRELELDFAGPLLLEDSESGQPVFIDPTAARAAYQRRLSAHLDRIASDLRGLGVVHRVCRTDQPLDEILAEVLAQRQATPMPGRGRR